MPESFDGKLVVAISSRALFDLEESNRMFDEQGVAAYHAYQRKHEDEILKPGIAFGLVNKLLALNRRDQQGHCESASMHVATGHVPFGVANQK